MTVSENNAIRVTGRWIKVDRRSLVTGNTYHLLQRGQIFIQRVPGRSLDFDNIVIADIQEFGESVTVCANYNSINFMIAVGMIAFDLIVLRIDLEYCATNRIELTVFLQDKNLALKRFVYNRIL